MIDGITSIGSSTTASQLRRALFKKLDTNGDGVIDKAEVKAALESGKKTSAAGSKGASLDQVFAKLDTNNDGVISQSEFDAALSKAQGSAGAYLSGTTSSLVNDPVAANGASAAGSASAQTGGVNNVLKNYLAQCGQFARQQTGQGFTTVV
jgi:Ca2+-binding EF-hand superfamily protein